MKKNKETAIARAIVLAQVASDGGKRITCIQDIFGEKSRRIWNQGYCAKDNLILKALRMIASSKDSRFRFFVRSFGRCAGIVYFQYNDSEGTRHQISFHTFGKEVIRFATLRRVKGELQQQDGSCHFVTNWDKKISRDTAVHIAEEFVPNQVNPKALDYYWNWADMGV